MVQTMPGCTGGPRTPGGARRIPAAWKCALVAAIAFSLRLPRVMLPASAEVRARLEATVVRRDRVRAACVDNATLRRKSATRSSRVPEPTTNLAVERLSPLSAQTVDLGAPSDAVVVAPTATTSNAAQPHHRPLLMSDADAEEDEVLEWHDRTDPECRRILNT